MASPRIEAVKIVMIENNILLVVCCTKEQFLGKNLFEWNLPVYNGIQMVWR